MTAEQAAEAAKGLTFEKVWAALMETRLRQEESLRDLKESLEESQKKTEKAMRKTMRDLAKNLGGLGNTIGSVTEAMFCAQLCKKFDGLGYTFNTQANRKVFYDERSENRRGVLAEVDSVLENGEYVMLVEIKTKLSIENVDDHLERIDIVRRYMDAHGDERKIVGAAAGGLVPENVLRHAQKNGLFVVVQSGNAAVVADMPQGLKAREW
jgi:hypothetical protein